MLRQSPREGQREKFRAWAFRPKMQTYPREGCVRASVAGGGTGVRGAGGVCLPVSPWSALARLGGSGQVRQRDRLPRHQALLPGSLKVQGLSARSVPPKNTAERVTRFSQNLLLALATGAELWGGLPAGSVLVQTWENSEGLQCLQTTLIRTVTAGRVRGAESRPRGLHLACLGWS